MAAGVLEEVAGVEATLLGRVEECLDSLNEAWATLGTSRTRLALGAKELTEELAQRVRCRAPLAITRRRTGTGRLAETEGLLRGEEVALQAPVLVELERRALPTCAVGRWSGRTEPIASRSGSSLRRFAEATFFAVARTTRFGPRANGTRCRRAEDVLDCLLYTSPRPRD